MAPSAGTLRVGRYFAVLLGLLVILYGVVCLAGSAQDPQARPRPRGWRAGHPARPRPRTVRPRRRSRWNRPSRSSRTGSTDSVSPRPRWSSRATTGSWCRSRAPAPTTSRVSAVPRCCSSGRCCRSSTPPALSSRTAPVTSDVCSTAVPTGDPECVRHAARPRRAPRPRRARRPSRRATAKASSAPTKAAPRRPRTAGSCPRPPAPPHRPRPARPRPPAAPRR